MNWSKYKLYFVYILSNKSNNVTYIGITNNLARRVYEHKNKMVEGFTSKYNVDKLIYYEEYKETQYALNREKQLKGWTKVKKANLINKLNPEWKDLYNQIGT